MFTGGGHTDGDTALFWRKANVLHTGDMMMSNAPFPFVDTSSGGSAVRLVASLDKLLAMTDGATKVIPGHGPVTDRARPPGVARPDRRRGRHGAQRAKASGKSLDAFLAANPFKAMDRPERVREQRGVRARDLGQPRGGSRGHGHQH